ncbi:hypothetical protein [Ureaplasma ceti]|uniref:Uncharacterized protein n=1 Tax=Ureaplasma ceti TaxID=3119530 RepID=A0ABP9U6L0_9BACT
MANNYFFIGSYVSKNGLYKTLKFIDRFSNELFNQIQALYHLDSVSIPKITTFNPKHDQRLINYDNRSSSTVYQLLNDANLYTVNLFHELKLEPNFQGLIWRNTTISRDVVYDSTHSGCEEEIWIRKRVTSVDKLKTTELLEKLTDEILEIMNEIFHRLVEELQIDTNFKFANFSTLSLKTFYTKFHTLKTDDFLMQKLSTDKLVLLTEIGDSSSRYLEEVDPIFDDLTRKSELLYFYEDISNIVPIISFSMLSTYEQTLIELQQRHVDVESLTTELELIKHSPDQMSIKINLSKLLMILLNKIHIGEVVPGSWPEELYLEAKEKGIHIL